MTCDIEVMKMKKTVVTDRGSNAPNTARALCTYVLCHTVSVNSHEIHTPSLGTAARRSAAGRSGS